MKSALFLTILTFFLSAFSFAQDVGEIEGQVNDENQRALSHVNVTLVGTSWGTFSQEDGSFLIKNIPLGTYELQFSMIGYSPETVSVRVEAESKSRVEVSLRERPVGTLQEVVIQADKERKPKRTGEIGDEIKGDELKDLPFEEVEEAIGNMAGVTKQGEEIHFRGGRGGEVVFKIDDVPVTDPLQGGTAAPASRGVEAIEATLGGITAEHGGALSGVVQYATKEGGQEYEGELYYMTDDYGQPDNTYTDLDRVYVGFGGPLVGVRGVTFYVGAEGTYSDGYPSSPRDQGRRRLLNFVSIGERNNNRIRLQGKLAWRVGSGSKLTAERIQERSRSYRYHHMWSRIGYVQTVRDTSVIGEVRIRHGKWSPVKLDETYYYYNPANHTPTNERRFTMNKLALRHTLNEASHLSFKLSRTEFNRTQRVNGKHAWEYDGNRLADYWFNHLDGETEPFFVIGGDYPRLEDQRTIVYDARGDVTMDVAAHQFKSGFSLTYDDVKYFEVVNPFNTGSDGLIGTQTRYHAYAPKGAVYFQDRWEYEGMVLNAGLRYDAYSVGDQISFAEVNDRVKGQFSPRVGVAYPVTDLTIFSFHYGRFYQPPQLQYVYAPAGVNDGRVRGNPNLQNETTSTYQAALEHYFSDLVSGQFAVYYKDIFGLISTEERLTFGSVQPVATWVNRDYASSRGFEVSLKRRFANGFGGEMNYTFGVASGTASDPNAQQSANFVYVPISEQPLNWDVRHSFSASMRFADADNWHASFVWSYSTGFPYTPYGRQTRELRPEIVNSRRLPATSNLDVQVQKRYSIWGQQIRLYLEASNLLDSKNISTLTPNNFPAPPSGTAIDYLVYYTETGKAGGAYVGEDENGDGIGEWVPLNDPRVFGDSRTVRVGVSFAF